MMIKKELYYRKIIHLGNTRYLAVGKFLPEWDNVFMIITKQKNGSFLIRLECADNARTSTNNTNQ